MAISLPRTNFISSGFNFKIMQTDTTKDMLRVILQYLLSFKLKRVFVLISLRSWRYCVLVEWDLAAEPPRAAKPREIPPAREP